MIYICISSSPFLERLVSFIFLPKAFDEMKRVSKRFAFTICYVEAITIVDGENVHATVWPKDKWIDTIKQYGKLYDKSQPSFNETNGFFIGEWKK